MNDYTPVKGATKVSEYSAITTECEKISELAENRATLDVLWQKKGTNFQVAFFFVPSGKFFMFPIFAASQKKFFKK